MYLISAVAGAIGAAIVTALVLKTVRAHVEPAHGKAILQYGKSLRWLVYFFWVCWIGGLIAAYSAPMPARLAAIYMIAASFVAILAMHLEFHNVRISFNSDGIATTSPWRASRVIDWSEVNGARYSAVPRWYVIDTVNSGRIRLHDYLNGVQSLLNELEARSIPVQRAGRRTRRGS